MSIIKRKAGSEDIVKSILEFDAVPTEGSPNLVESGAVAQAIGNIGKPLVWKGPATVAQLNAGITGIQEGWTYTLTDAGTLTDGNIDVESGDEVAWTENDEWFKVGGDTGKVEVFQVIYDTDHFVWPSFDNINTQVVTKKKSVCLVQNNPGGSRVIWWLSSRSAGIPNQYYKFISDSGKLLTLFQDNTVKIETVLANSDAIAPDYADLTFPVAEGTACMFGGTRYVAATTISTTEDWTPAHWTQQDVETQIGTKANIFADNGSKTESDISNGKFTIAAGNSTTKLTLTSISTLTILANSGAPNFALTIDNSGNANDVALSVKTSDEVTTLYHSTAGGTSVGAGKIVQVTAVGDCWTIAEVEA